MENAGLTVWFWDATGLAAGYTKHNERAFDVVRTLLSRANDLQRFRMFAFAAIELSAAYRMSLQNATQSNLMEFEHLLNEDISGHHRGQEFELFQEITMEALSSAKEAVYRYPGLNAISAVHLAMFLHSVKQDLADSESNIWRYFFVTTDVTLAAIAETEAKIWGLKFQVIDPSNVAMEEIDRAIQS